MINAATTVDNLVPVLLTGYFIFYYEDGVL